MINWHRLFGLVLIDFFTNTPYEVELEKDLSLKQQFLDVVIIRKTGDALIELLPDGLDDLGDHSLITYKSLREPLDTWAIQELIGHYVNYRKQISDDKLLPESIFRLYAIATRFPQALFKQIKPKLIRQGIYDLQYGMNKIRVIVLNKIPKIKNNALWCIFSAMNENVNWGVANYTMKSKISTIVNELYEYYQLEGVNMTYTRVDYEREMTQKFLNSLPPEERLRGLPPEERLRGLLPEERLRGLPPEERLRGLPPDEVLNLYRPEEIFKHYKLEERLAGLTEKEIRTYLEQIQGSKNN